MDLLINPIKGGLQLRILIVERPVRIIYLDNWCCSRMIPSAHRVHACDRNSNARRPIRFENDPGVYNLTQLGAYFLDVNHLRALLYKVILEP